MKNLPLFVLLCSSALAAGAEAAPLDHFKCYPSEAEGPVGAEVFLRDQFGDGRAQVGEPKLFCNPTEKLFGRTRTEIEDHNAHLEFFYLEDEQRTRPREVLVRNQMRREPQRLSVERSVLLAAPTWKLRPNEHRPPKGLDHFRCYEAAGEPIDAGVALRDQFGFERDLRVVEPKLLCNPVEKTHEERVSRIQNPGNHLVCYGLENARIDAKVVARNQFGQRSLPLRPAELLCVPSSKERVDGKPLPGDETQRAGDDFSTEAAPPPFQTCQVGANDQFVVTGSETTAPGDEHCFPSDGAGGFGPRADIPRLEIVDGMDVADMDGDGDNDFLVCDGRQGEVYLYTQAPAGHFTPTVVATNVTTGVAGSVFCTNLRIADFDEDGQNDFVVGDNRVTNGMFVFRQGPAGTFSRVAPGLDVAWASPSGAPCNCLFGVAAGDVDGDSHSDVLVLGYRGAGVGQVRFYRGNGAGGMAAPVVKFNLSSDFPVADAPTGIALFDADGDGDLDVVAGGAGDGSHYVYANDGAGNFTAPAGPAFDVDNYTGIDAYDVTGDGDDDLMLVDWSNRRLLYGENTGGGPAAPVQVGTLRGSSIGIGAPRLEPSTGVALDHFKCYPSAGGQPEDSSVVLRDQFGGDEARVADNFSFCNATAKIHDENRSPIRDEDAHLALYKLDPRSEGFPRRVQVSNQFFREQTLEVGRPAALAVPSQKIEPRRHEPPRRLDHFKCYEARGEPAEAGVALRDQFGFEEGLKVLEPRLLCNPTEKIHRDQITEIRDPEAHLVCYRLVGTQLATGAAWRNQFGAMESGLEPAEMLCVPSRKHEPEQDPNITQLCGDYDAVDFDGGMVAPGGPGTGLLREDPSAAFPDGRPRRPCGTWVPIDGFLPSGGVKRFRVAFRDAGAPIPPLGSAPGIQTKWILRDRSMSPFCQVNAANVLETTGPQAWMDASDYLDAKNGGPATNWCPNSGLRLAVWDSPSAPDKDGHYVVWLEWEDGGGVLHKEPFEHHLQLDNTPPVVHDLLVTLKDGTTPVGACGEAPAGQDTFRVSGWFSDDYYWGYRINVRGGNPPTSRSFPLAGEEPDGNGWHDYYEGIAAVANTDRTGTTPPGGLRFLREIDMNAFGAAFTDCCYLLELFAREATIRHSFNHRVANKMSWSWDSKFITFSASP